MRSTSSMRTLSLKSCGRHDTPSSCFSGGVHGVFFTSEVDQARAHHALPPAAPETATLMTDDGSRPLSPAELATLTTEADSLVASLHLPEPTTPLVPRAPWMMDGDPRSDADGQSSSTIMLPSTIGSAVTPLPDPDPVQGPRNLHPYLRSHDATAYYYAVPIRLSFPFPFCGLSIISFLSFDPMKQQQNYFDFNSCLHWSLSLFFFPFSFSLFSFP